MKYRKIIMGFQFLLVLLYLSDYSYAQFYSPGRNWAGITQYSRSGVIQDSVFVYFSTPTNPLKGTLKVKFSDGSKSIYTWFKYNDAVINPVNRFEQIGTATDSIQPNLNSGGYKVSVRRAADDSTEVYTCWLMIDDVVITGINVDSNCDFLFLDTKLLPSRSTVVYDYFTYWDLSKINHPEINKIGIDYFKSLTWHASNSRISTPSTSLSLLLENPAPLYDSKYDIRIINPFGRILQYETDLLMAKAPKADFLVYIDKDGIWEKGDLQPTGEAPLKIKLESKSINADSCFWHIINDEKLFHHGADSIVWSDSSFFSDRIDAYPPPELMVPGTYPVQHIAKKISSGCRDTMVIFVLVDSSAIKPDAIPNVFSPNGDSENPYFKFKEPEKNISSIKAFSIVIISRGGQQVYSYSGDPKTWEGWNGKIDGNKGDAPEGVYYYIIEAKGWDNKVFKRGKYKGFLHLFRGR